jgi:hypothetical protein
MSAELPLEEQVEDDGKPIDAGKLRSLLRRKYPADQYAMLYEVRDAAGFSAKRSADVMLIGLWPSRGNMVEGMEVKISRSDWLRELKKPEKAEAFFEFCDRWWVIASSPDIVKISELPPTWGLMVPRGKGLGVLVEAPILKPKPVDRSLLAAMLKRATDTAADSPEVQALIELRVKNATDRVDERINWATRNLTDENKRLKEAFAEFEKASGLAISKWNAGDVGAAVKIVMRGEHENRLRQLHSIKSQAKNLVEWLETNVPDSAPQREAK